MAPRTQQEAEYLVITAGPHDPSERSIARWINEGGAPKGVDRSRGLDRGLVRPKKRRKRFGKKQSAHSGNSK